MTKHLKRLTAIGQKHAIAPKLQAELTAQGRGESRDSLVDLFGGSSGEGCTEEHVLLNSVVVRLEPATAREQNACVDGSQEDIFFDLAMSLAGADAGMLAPIDLDPVLVRVSVVILYGVSYRKRKRINK